MCMRACVAEGATCMIAVWPCSDRVVIVMCERMSPECRECAPRPSGSWTKSDMFMKILTAPHENDRADRQANSLVMDTTGGRTLTRGRSYWCLDREPYPQPLMTRRRNLSKDDPRLQRGVGIAQKFKVHYRRSAARGLQTCAPSRLQHRARSKPDFLSEDAAYQVDARGYSCARLRRARSELSSVAKMIITYSLLSSTRCDFSDAVICLRCGFEFLAESDATAGKQRNRGVLPRVFTF